MRTDLASTRHKNRVGDWSLFSEQVTPDIRDWRWDHPRSNLPCLELNRWGIEACHLTRNGPKES